MFHGFLLGVLGGVAAAKLWHGCRRGDAEGHGFGAGFACGNHFAGCRGEGAFRGRFEMFRLMRELQLTPEQWQSGQEILRDLRSSLQAGRTELRSSLTPLLTLLSETEFDAARAEELAHLQDASYAKVRKEALDALSRLHALLSTTQRERLRRFVSECERYR